MFRRPSDPSPPLEPLRGGNEIAELHRAWARMHPPSRGPETLWRRLRGKWRSLSSRITNGDDRRLLGDLVRAVDAAAARCDTLSERVANLEVTVDDLARILGEEVTRLRAAVEKTSESDPG